MTDEDLTTGAEGAEKPLSNEIMDADSMAAQAGLEDAAHQQDEMAGREEPAGDIVPEATPIPLPLWILLALLVLRQ